MKIVDIFAEVFPGHLYAVILDKDLENEFDRNLENWTSVEYLRNYASVNKINDQISFIKNITKEVGEIDDVMLRVINRDVELNYFFRPLSNSEFLDKVLSLQKGKFGSQKFLRIYAIKIESNCFLITGGAIKLKRTMQEHPETMKELYTLHQVKSFLINQGILDSDAINEYVFEIN
jgi:hypothetical protein